MIDFGMEWQEVPCTCEPCTACKEIIYGKQYQLFALGEPTETILCESCYVKVEEED
jgi:hypothetical protein